MRYGWNKHLKSRQAVQRWQCSTLFEFGVNQWIDKYLSPNQSRVVEVSAEATLPGVYSDLIYTINSRRMQDGPFSRRASNWSKDSSVFQHLIPYLVFSCSNLTSPALKSGLYHATCLKPYLLTCSTRPVQRAFVVLLRKLSSAQEQFTCNWTSLTSVDSATNWLAVWGTVCVYKGVCDFMCMHVSLLSFPNSTSEAWEKQKLTHLHCKFSSGFSSLAGCTLTQLSVCVC